MERKMTMFITQRKFDEEINKAYMRGYYDGKLIGEMGAENKAKVKEFVANDKSKKEGSNEISRK